jgi:hypothetical protein
MDGQWKRPWRQRKSLEGEIHLGAGAIFGKQMKRVVR